LTKRARRKRLALRFPIPGTLDDERDNAGAPHPRLEMAGIILRSVLIAVAITGGVWLAVDFALTLLMSLPP